MKKYLLYYFTTVLCFVFVLSCATTALLITVKRPAEVNLKDYKQLAIGDIVDASGRVTSHTNDVGDGLASTLFSSGFFQVLDREHLNTIMKEHKLNFSGLVDENTAAQLGELVGAAVLVFGRLQTDKYEEEDITKGDPWKDKNGGYHQSYYRKGKYRLILSIKLIDIQTGRIIAIKDLPAEYSAQTKADNKLPPDIDKDALYTACLKNVLNQFLRLVAPYDVQVKANFETDKMLPEIDKAITQFKIGEWDVGLSLLEQATQKTGLEQKTYAKTYYNLGLAQMYGGNPEIAIENFKKAMSINPSSKRYQDSIVEAKAEKDKMDKLKEQID